MDFTKRLMKGFVMVDDIRMNSKKEFNYWINLALAFNKKAKSYKKLKSELKLFLLAGSINKL
jgi:hypothetical protein